MSCLEFPRGVCYDCIGSSPLTACQHHGKNHPTHRTPHREAMIQASAFRFSGYQAAAFYAELQLTARKALPSLLSQLADILDGDPIVLPVPREGPPEIPRLFLTNKDQSLRFEISLVRADVRWQLKEPGVQLDLQQFCEFARHAFAVFHEVTPAATPGRIALVVHRFQLHENPGKAIAAHFCRPALLSNDPNRKGPLNRPQHFELHAHKRFSLGRFQVNSWVRVKTGTFTEGGKEQPIIFVEQDLNTLAERLADTEFSEDDILEFHHLCINELDFIMRLYFPDVEK